MPYYITTPIYYVNAKPHLGHAYTTMLADVAARAARLIHGPDDVFFLTGTDEHADKVVNAAAEHGLTPQQWADQNAQAFKDAFDQLGCTHDDFIRTTEDRHTSKVHEYVRRLEQSGDIGLGDYTGWYDPGQEEYVTETVAREHDFKSPVTGKPLEERTERNYFFKLSRYESRLIEAIESGEWLIEPDARRNEVLGRLRQGLRDVPISRAVSEEDPASRWGVLMPDDPSHRVYVWIDALFNYLSAVDTEERERFWPADVHVIAKDILWFHAVIWPAMLMALDKPLPKKLYVHAYWMMGERKMSKSLGNFVSVPELVAYADRYSLDAVRWFLATQGPVGANDAEFSYPRFVDVYNADLANGFGNSTSRVGNMIAKYFDGQMPDAKGATNVEGGLDGSDWPTLAQEAASKARAGFESFDIKAALDAGLDLVRAVDGYINQTAPFRLAKTLDEQPENRDRLAAILAHCAEALRIASIILSPALPDKTHELWRNWNCQPKPNERFDDLVQWGRLAPGTAISKGEVLFMRADPKLDQPMPKGIESDPASES
mgnify:CR=1 FL=1